MTAAVVVLNPAAQAALAAAEQRIERALNGFVDMGQALTEIRDGRLYKATHSNFETYCQERWDIGRDYADRMIAAAQVVLTIVSKGLPAPTKESQARALVAVPEPERADVWRETVERTNGKPTAKAVEEIAKERTRPTPTPGPVDAATTPPADPGVTPAPAVESPAPAAPQEPDPELAERVFRVLAGASDLGMTVPEVWCKVSGARSDEVQAAVTSLADAGRVLVASTSKHGARWVVTPEPSGAVPSAAQPDGSGSTVAAVPGEDGAAAALAGCEKCGTTLGGDEAAEGYLRCDDCDPNSMHMAGPAGACTACDPAERLDAVRQAAPEFVRPVDDSAARVAAALDQHVPDPDAPKRAWGRELYTRVKPVHDFLLWLKTEDVAAFADEQDVTTLRHLATGFAEAHRRAVEARTATVTPLRRIK